VEEKEKKKSQRIIELRLDRIDPNPDQPRKSKTEEGIDSLSASIRDKGVLQPILIRPKGERFEIVAGERRWLAAKKAGFEKIPVVIKDYSESEVLEIALVENLQREDLNPLEKAEAYQRLLENFGYTQEKLAESMGKSRSTITNTLRLLDLEPKIKEDLGSGTISEGHARALLGVEAGERLAIWKRIRTGGISVRQTELLVKKVQNEKREIKKEVKVESKKTNLQFIENNLEELFGTKVRIRQGEKKGAIEIEFFGEQDLIRLLDIILKK
jgi:ParB family transcriptional regulator, chromosome partitioning protein